MATIAKKMPAPEENTPRSAKHRYNKGTNKAKTRLGIDTSAALQYSMILARRKGKENWKRYYVAPAPKVAA